VSETTAADRKAPAAEVRAHADQLRQLAEQVGVSNVRLLDEGTVVVHSDELGYREVVDLSRRISEVVGCYVHVITDDVPAAADARSTRQA
jgi:predicted RecB family endonuclease